MPNLDGTGPNEQGPRTGRGLGNCPGTGGTFQNLRRGRGQGLGVGRFNKFWNVCPFCPLNQQNQDIDQTNEEIKKQNTKDNK